MNSSVRQDPWRQVPRVQDVINRLFGIVNQGDNSANFFTFSPLVFSGPTLILQQAAGNAAVPSQANA
jgi:hypothetical protein